MKPRRIRTSADLLEWFPEVGEDPVWDRFSLEFDKPCCIQHRAKAIRSCREKQDVAVSELHAYCSRILDAEMLIGLPNVGDDGEETYSTIDEVTQDQVAAAKLLAEKVRLLLSVTTEGKALRSTLNRGSRRKLPNNPKSLGATLIFRALVTFIFRHKRLPLKRELNVEARRVSKAKTVCADWTTFEKATLEDGSPSNDKSGPYFVHSWRKDFAHDEFGDVRVWGVCDIVPALNWNEPKWPPSTFSEIARDSGMNGLDDDHKSKGKKCIGVQSRSGTKKVRKA